MKPWVVCLIIFACFSVLAPKIFVPMFKQLFGLNQRSAQEEALERLSNMHPAARARGISPNDIRSTGGKPRSSHMSPAMHAADMRQQAQHGQQGGGRGGIMTMVLPVYGVGIIIYLIYMFAKMWGSKGEGEGEGDDRRSYEAKRKRELEDAYRKIRFNPKKQEFQYGGDEDSDLEGLDEDYKEFIKKKRRQKQFEHLLEKCDDVEDYDNMTTQELHVLQQRLMETEEQMRHIMEAMQNASKKTANVEEMTRAKQAKQRTSSGKEELNRDDEVETVGAGSNDENQSQDENEQIEEIDVDDMPENQNVDDTSENQNEGAADIDGSVDGEEGERFEISETNSRTESDPGSEENMEADQQEEAEVEECEMIGTAEEERGDILKDGVRKRTVVADE